MAAHSNRPLDLTYRSRLRPLLIHPTLRVISWVDRGRCKIHSACPGTVMQQLHGQIYRAERDSNLALWQREGSWAPPIPGFVCPTSGSLMFEPTTDNQLVDYNCRLDVFEYCKILLNERRIGDGCVWHVKSRPRPGRSRTSGPERCCCWRGRRVPPPRAATAAGWDSSTRPRYVRPPAALLSVDATRPTPPGRRRSAPDGHHSSTGWSCTSRPARQRVARSSDPLRWWRLAPSARRVESNPRRCHTPLTFSTDIFCRHQIYITQIYTYS